MEYLHTKRVILCNLYHINVSVKFKEKVQSSQTTDGLNMNSARICFNPLWLILKIKGVVSKPRAKWQCIQEWQEYKTKFPFLHRQQHKRDPPKNTGTFECLILHNIIFSKSPSKTAKDEKSYTFDNKNERHVKLALSLGCKCASLNWLHYLLSKCLTLVDYFTINLKQRIYSNNLKNKSNKLVFGSVN